MTMPRNQIVGMIDISSRTETDGWLFNQCHAENVVLLRGQASWRTLPSDDPRRLRPRIGGQGLDRRVIQADLHQLQVDLRAELRKLVDRLGATA
jgi:hypothetical protein